MLLSLSIAPLVFHDSDIGIRSIDGHLRDEKKKKKKNGARLQPCRVDDGETLASWQTHRSMSLHNQFVGWLGLGDFLKWWRCTGLLLLQVSSVRINHPFPYDSRRKLDALKLFLMAHSFTLSLSVSSLYVRVVLSATDPRELFAITVQATDF